VLIMFDTNYFDQFLIFHIFTELFSNLPYLHRVMSLSVAYSNKVKENEYLLEHNLLTGLSG